MADINIVARPTLEDCSLKGQMDRLESRPIMTTNAEKAEFTCMEGRTYIALNLIHTVFREPYREVKNVLVVLEKIVNLFRTFFECLFHENHWSVFTDRTNETLSATTAIVLRPLTWTFDLAKLTVGIAFPKAAIRVVEAPLLPVSTAPAA